jgi:guanylate kinase
VHGNLYGTPRAALRERMARGEDVLLDIDYQGGLAIKRAFPDTVAIFLLPPNMEVLEQRLRGRASDDEYQITRRLEVATHEISYAGQYDYVVVNHDLERTYDAVAEIVRSERRRVSRIDPARLGAWGAPRPA